MEEPGPEKSGVLPKEEECKAPLAKASKLSMLPLNEVPEAKFAGVPGPHAERPPEKGARGTTYTVPETQESPKLSQAV